MIFPNLIVDNLVQVDDMLRLDAQKSFVNAGIDITEINIYPDFVGAPATKLNVYVLDCPEDWHLDWAYAVAGDYTVKVEIVTAASGTVDKTYDVSVVTEADDHLLSNDAMIYSYENELKGYLPEGRNSWKYMHRKALEEILDYLYRNAILNPDGTKIEKTQLIGDKLELWATYETMLLIYQEIKTSNSAAFNEKMVDYSAKRAEARERYLISYDSNKDSVIDEKDVPRATQVTYFSR